MALKKTCLSFILFLMHIWLSSKYVQKQGAYIKQARIETGGLYGSQASMYAMYIIGGIPEVVREGERE
jgi:hypothetical protein